MTRWIGVLLVLMHTGACASLLGPRPRLTVATDSVRASVREPGGAELGTTPLDTSLAPARRTLVVSAPGYRPDTVHVRRRFRPVTLLNLAPLAVWGATGRRDWTTLYAGWASLVALLTDLYGGRAWDHSPRVVRPNLVRDVTAPPEPDPPPPGGEEAGLPYAERSEILARFGDAMERSGCEPMAVDIWRDRAREERAAAGPAAVLADSVRSRIAAAVERAVPQIRSLCAEPSERMDDLRRIRLELESAEPPPPPEPDAALLAPVYFGFGEREVGPDSVRRRLRALGESLARSRFPLRLLVVGFTDPVGSDDANRELGLARAAAVIREIRAGGLEDCCIAVSHGKEREFQAVPGAGGGATGARLNRRVTFALGPLREEDR